MTRHNKCICHRTSVFNTLTTKAGMGELPPTGLVSTPLDEVQVQLCDAALGRPVKIWRFRGRQTISIGRMPESDVEISDLRVSRVHAQLDFRDGKWVLVSCGRHGVVVENRQITELVLDSDVTFQLGSAGPVLRFCRNREDPDCGRTLTLDSELLPVVTLDKSKLHEEVGQIVESDYFQKLQAQARSLRARRNP